MRRILRLMLSRKVFAIRTLVLLFVVLTMGLGYLELRSPIALGILGAIRLYHLVWAIVMTEMILVLIPGLDHFYGCGKAYMKNYIPRPHDPDELRRYTKTHNRRALVVMVIWLAFIMLLALLSLSPTQLFLSFVVLYFLDPVFVNIGCPIQRLIVRNRCCATCRIYNWGFPMIVSALLFIPSFWSYSLVAISLIILAQWEILHHKYPERFSELSNQVLACSHCNDKCRQMLQKTRVSSREKPVYGTKKGYLRQR